MKKIISVFLLATLISCSHSLVPSKNTTITDEIIKGQRVTDSVYNGYISGSDKSYSAAAYDVIQNEITLAAAYESARQSIIASQVTILQTHFNYYRSQHQIRGTLNNAQLQTYKNDLDAYWQPILNGELSFH